VQQVAAHPSPSWMQKNISLEDGQREAGESRQGANDSSSEGKKPARGEGISLEAGKLVEQLDMEVATLR